MNTSKDIIADIVILGDIKGNPSLSINNGDTLGLGNLSIVEGDVDFGVPFDYLKETKNFSITQGRLNLKTGVAYKLRGIGVDEFGKTPTVFIPSPVNVDSIFAYRQLNNKYKLNVFVSEYDIRDEYYYIQVKDENGLALRTTFNKNAAAYKPLHHKPGFLVDGSRIDDGVLEILVDSGSQGLLKNLKVELSNVSTSYYEFNYFYSNESQTGGLLNNPPIAAFNIRTKTAYGSFSALNTVQKMVPIR